MRAAEAVLDLLFPPKCPFCGTLLEDACPVCPSCRRELPWLRGQDGERAVEPTAGCVSPLRYEGAVRAAIHAYKFGGQDAKGSALGRLIARCCQERGVDGELVSWPPLSRKRLRERGYDQARLLAESVGRQLGMPVVCTMKKHDVPAQSGLTDASARRANVKGAYDVRRPELVRGRRIILVDDVVTTGSTLSECARVLLLAGAAQVRCATLAQTPKRGGEAEPKSAVSHS